MKNTLLKIAVSIALLAATAPAATFTDWTTVDTQSGIAQGTLDGVSVSLSGSGVNWGVTDGLSTAFNSALFTPPLPLSDVVGFASPATGITYTINFGGPIQDPVLHLRSLASTLTFTATNITRLSGDPDFTVAGSSVSGVLNDSPSGYDANGTVRLEGTFTSITFTAVYSGPPLRPPEYDGIFIQVGGVAAQPRLAIRVSQVELCWDTFTNGLYRLEYRSDLTTNAWTSLGEVIQGDGSRFCTNDAVVVGLPQRFYRVVRLP